REHTGVRAHCGPRTEGHCRVRAERSRDCLCLQRRAARGAIRADCARRNGHLRERSALHCGGRLMPRLVPAPRRDAPEQRDGERPAPRSIPEIHEQTRSLRPAPQRSSGPTRMDAVLSGASSGMLESFPLIGGVAGAALTGGSPIGLGLGIAAGELVKRAYRATMDVPTVDEMPPELRPFFVGGEILGGSLAPGMAPFAAGRARTGVRFVDRIIESAQQRPVAFTAAEASAAIGSATGAGLSSRIFDGNPWAELAGGVAGGVFSPGSASFTATGLFSDAYSRARAMLSTAGRTNRAAAELH